MAITEDDRLALRAKLNETLGEREARVLMELLGLGEEQIPPAAAT